MLSLLNILKQTTCYTPITMVQEEATEHLLQMYDTWLNEVEEDNMVGVMMIDLSAAFDMVDHPLLLEKLKLHGLDRKIPNMFE